MIKTFFASAALASVAVFSIAATNETPNTDLANHETIKPGPDETKIVSEASNTSDLHEVLQTRVTAGDYDGQFAKTLPDGTNMLMRMTYANYDFQPVWTRESVGTLVNLCRTDLALPSSCKSVSDIAKTRFVSDSKVKQADADVALTRIYLSYAANTYHDVYMSGKWVDRDTGGSEPILVASLRAAGAGGVQDGVEVLNPEASKNIQYGSVSPALSSGPLP